MDCKKAHFKLSFLRYLITFVAISIVYEKNV